MTRATTSGSSRGHGLDAGRRRRRAGGRRAAGRRGGGRRRGRGSGLGGRLVGVFRACARRRAPEEQTGRRSS
ncbi:MAG: hypothetical protein MZV64_73220 [Ignavibacteriales bacterium]|nr:hypothetical protein [Ignavibacteriales bacterium]